MMQAVEVAAAAAVAAAVVAVVAVVVAVSLGAHPSGSRLACSSWLPHCAGNLMARATRNAIRWPRSSQTRR